MIFRIKFFLSILVQICFAESGIGQLSYAMYNQKELWFDKIVSIENTSLINGPEYFIPVKTMYTHLFFGSGKSLKEQIKYDHQLYFDVPLLYDIYSDMLILHFKDRNGSYSMIEVDKKKVESFTLGNHNFRKLEDPNRSSSDPEFFDLLFEGKHIALVSKRAKGKYILNGGIEFQQEDQFYLIKDNRWIHLSGNKSYYRLMVDDKTKIKEFIQSKNIKVKKQSEQDMIEIAAFCETLLQPELN